MTNEERINYICFLQGAMRPMTEKEIAEMQKKNVPLMMNSQMSASGQAGMQNFWSQEPGWEDGYKLA